nr:MAG TPA: glycosyltransferase [Caudoviricetes sp.]
MISNERGPTRTSLFFFREVCKLYYEGGLYYDLETN